MKLFLFALALLSLHNLGYAAPGGGKGPPDRGDGDSSDCDSAQPATIDGTFDGRPYTLYVPEANCDSSAAKAPIDTPLVVAFHPYSGSKDWFSRYTFIEDLAGGATITRKAAVLYLQGSKIWRRNLGWNDHRDRNQVKYEDDVRYTMDAIDHVGTMHFVGGLPSEIYAIGYSMGGGFVQRLAYLQACAASISPAFAGFATINSSLQQATFEDEGGLCTPAGTVPFFQTNGTADTIAGFCDGDDSYCPDDWTVDVDASSTRARQMASVETTVDFWARLSGCDAFLSDDHMEILHTPPPSPGPGGPYFSLSGWRAVYRDAVLLPDDLTVLHIYTDNTVPDCQYTFWEVIDGGHGYPLARIRESTLEPYSEEFDATEEAFRHWGLLP